MKIVLRVTSAQTKEVVEAVFDRLPVLIGRSKICDLVLDDGIASRQHAVLELNDQGQLQVVDLQSANGVIFQNQKVQKQVLTEGDEFRLGDSLLQIEKLKVLRKEESTVHDLTPVQELVPPELTGTKVIVSQAPAADPKKAKPSKPSKPLPTEEEVLERTSAPVTPPSMPTETELTMKTPLALRSSVPARGLRTKDWVQVSLFWKDELIDIRCFDKGRAVRVGKKADNDFTLEGIDLPESIPFLKVQPQGLEINLSFGASGLVETRGKTEDLVQLRKQARQTEMGLTTLLPFQDRCLIELGPFSFFIQSVRLLVREELETPLIKEPVYAGILGSVAIFFSLFLVFVFSIPALEAEEEQEEFGIVQLEMPQEPPQVRRDPPPPPPPPARPAPQAERAQARVQESGTQGAGARASGAAGQRGDQSSPADSGGRRIAFQTKEAPPRPVPPRGASGEQAQAQAQRGLQRAQGAGTARPRPQAEVQQGPSLQPRPEVRVEAEGLAGVFGAQGGGGRAAQGGRAEGTGLGGDLEGALQSGQERGGLTGTRGRGGRGDQGSDYGGGGSSIEVGGIATQGRGGGQTGFGLGTSGTVGQAEVSYTIQEVTVLDGLTREEIERVVNANQNQIRACYERALIQSGNQDLAGRLRVGWFVDRQGKAINVQRRSEFGVEAGLFNCVSAAIASWQFPQPRGGRGAQVTWPFVFRKGG